MDCTEVTCFITEIIAGLNYCNLSVSVCVVQYTFLAESSKNVTHLSVVKLTKLGSVQIR